MGETLARMSTGPLITVRLDPEASGQVIAGWIGDGGGDEHYFTGWLGLLTMLEQARQVATAEPEREKADGA